MSVLRGQAAVDELKHRLGAAPPDAPGKPSPWASIDEKHPYVTADLAGSTSPPPGSLWSTTEPVAQLRDPAAYASVATAELSETRAAISHA